MLAYVILPQLVDGLPPSVFVSNAVNGESCVCIPMAIYKFSTTQCTLLYHCQTRYSIIRMFNCA